MAAPRNDRQAPNARHAANAPKLQSERVAALLDAALEKGAVQPFFDVLIRHGGIPGPRPNLELARAVGSELAGRGLEALELEAELLAQKHLFLFRVGMESLAARASRIKRAAAGVELLHDHADEVDADRRNVVTDALALLVEAKGDEVAVALARFTDGFLHATIALEALTRPGSLSRLSKPEPLFERFGEAFDLADDAPRSADRAQGVRELRRTLPAQLARTAGRFEDLTLAWIEERCARERPETREVLAETISKLRPVIGEPAADRLRAALSATAPLPRDPSRIVHGTRKRSRGR